MAYSFLAYKEGDLDWEKFRDSSASIAEGAIEIFPILISEEENESCIGISIPIANLEAGAEIWVKIDKVIKMCFSPFNLRVYDLYSGQYVFYENINDIKKHIL